MKSSHKMSTSTVSSDNGGLPVLWRFFPGQVLKNCFYQRIMLFLWGAALFQVVLDLYCTNICTRSALQAIPGSERNQAKPSPLYSKLDLAMLIQKGWGLRLMLNVFVPARTRCRATVRVRWVSGRTVSAPCSPLLAAPWASSTSAALPSSAFSLEVIHLTSFYYSLRPSNLEVTKVYVGFTTGI